MEFFWQKIMWIQQLITLKSNNGMTTFFFGEVIFTKTPMYTSKYKAETVSLHYAMAIFKFFAIAEKLYINFAVSNCTEGLTSNRDSLYCQLTWTLFGGFSCRNDSGSVSRPTRNWEMHTNTPGSSSPTRVSFIFQCILNKF